MKSLYHLYAVLPIIHTKNRKLFFFPFYFHFPPFLLLLLYCPCSIQDRRCRNFLDTVETVRRAKICPVS